MEHQNPKKNYLKGNTPEKILSNPLSAKFMLPEVEDRHAESVQGKVRSLLRELLQVPADFQVLVLDNRVEENKSIFSLLNFSKTNRGGFLDSGSRSAAAITAARKLFDCQVIGSSRESAYSYVPSCDWIPENISFLHLTSTNELEGNRLFKYPRLSLPVICDRSADLFYDQISFGDFDLIYAHGGNPIIPRDLSVIFIRDSIFESVPPIFIYPLITMLDCDEDQQAQDLLLLNQNLKVFKENGGTSGHVSRIHRISSRLYREVERNIRFLASVNIKDRSPQAIRFSVVNIEDEFQFILLLDQEDLNILERSPNGDLLISLQNCNEDDAQRLINLMERFERNNK